MILYLIRHGQAKANIENRVTGTMSDALTECGREQVKLLRPLLHAEKFACCYVSPWRRTQETWELLNISQVPVIAPEIAETYAGRVANWTKTQFNQAFPDYWDPFRPDRPYCGGESHGDLYRRVIQWLESVEKSFCNDEKILVVTHNGPINCLLHHADNTPMKDFPAYQVENASLHIVVIEKNRLFPS